MLYNTCDDYRQWKTTLNLNYFFYKHNVYIFNNYNCNFGLKFMINIYTNWNEYIFISLNMYF
jgi:hypothetical protein